MVSKEDYGNGDLTKFIERLALIVEGQKMFVQNELKSNVKCWYKIDLRAILISEFGMVCRI